MRRALFFLSGFALVAGIVFSIFKDGESISTVSESKQDKKESSVADRSPTQYKASEPVTAASPQGKTAQNLTPVERFIQQESARVGKPDPDPISTQRKLKALAESLKRLDIQSLKRAALDHSLNNDQRFLSAYILSLSSSPDTKAALFSIASDPLTVQDISSRVYAEELMIRTQALEGLSKHQPRTGRGPIDDFLARQDNSFLADQARRILQERRSRR